MTQPIPPGTPDLGDVPALVEQANLGPAPVATAYVVIEVQLDANQLPPSDRANADWLIQSQADHLARRIRDNLRSYVLPADTTYTVRTRDTAAKSGVWSSAAEDGTR